MQIVQINGLNAEVEVDGVRRKVRLDLLPNAQLGDYVLVHAGMAIALMDEQEAQNTLSLLKEYLA